VKDPSDRDPAGVAIWALIPVKSFERGKSRLSAVLNAPDRVAFARSLLEHVLGIVAAIPEIAGTMVVTDGADVAGLVQQQGVVVVREIHPEPLSAIVDRALVELSGRGARSALVLMSDLPLLEAADVQGVVERMRAADVVVVPDFHEEGTNALGLTPPDGFPTSFGMRDSFRRHCDRAEHAALRVEVVRSEGLMFDVDGPDEWARLQAARRPPMP
jgi:2-phospho-L-lactate/phosphoenolpyruvate guanylyltransferase